MKVFFAAGAALSWYEGTLQFFAGNSMAGVAGLIASGLFAIALAIGSKKSVAV